MAMRRQAWEIVWQAVHGIANMYTRMLFLAFVPVVLSAGGCGPHGPKRVDVTGTVKFKGEPIPEGEIRFIPTTEAMGRVTGNSIENGAYKCLGQNGLAVGKHRVDITAYRWKPGVKPDLDSPPWALKQQYLPEKYGGKKTTLEFDVPDTRSGLTKDFDLEP
jgi:hypothetical protein